MSAPRISLREVRRARAGTWSEAETDSLAVEEPLEIRIDGKSLAVIMRTPGEDRELATGFLITEGIIGGASDIKTIRTGEGEKPADKNNVIDIDLAAGVEFDSEAHGRSFFISSSCGICGKGSIEAATSLSATIAGRWQVEPALIQSLSTKLRSRQRVFDQTGSIHAAGVFDLEGTLLHIAEDIGRHNAVDKVVGAAANAHQLPLDQRLLAVSGRISFEIVQKAMMARLPAIIAVSGASSLAVDLAEDRGMTLVGFARGDSMTVYTGGARIN